MTNLQRGIAIGPILFVVAILAILASAIAAGSGAFSGDTSAVKAKAQATAILEYANEVKMGVDRVLGHGCTDTQVSFENPIVSGYTNPNAPSDKSCHVFDVNGGGIAWKTPDMNVLDQSWLSAAVPPSAVSADLFGNYVFITACGAHLGKGGGPLSGYNAAGWPCCYDASGPERASETADLFLILPWMKEAVYQELYRQTGMKGEETQRNGTISWVKFKGSYLNGMIRVDKGSNTGIVQGVVDGANNVGVPGSALYGGYYYFLALIVR